MRDQDPSGTDDGEVPDAPQGPGNDAQPGGPAAVEGADRRESSGPVEEGMGRTRSEGADGFEGYEHAGTCDPTGADTDEEALQQGSEGDATVPSTAATPPRRARFVWITLDRDAVGRIHAALEALRGDAGDGADADMAPDETGSTPDEPSSADPGGRALSPDQDPPSVTMASTVVRPPALQTTSGEMAEESTARSDGERVRAEPASDGVAGEASVASAARLDEAAASAVVSQHSDDTRADLAVFPLFVDERPLGGMFGLFDWRAAGRFTRLVDAEGERAGEVGHALLTVGGATLPASRVVLLGLGATAAFDEAAAEAAAARIGQIVRDLRPRSVVFGASTAPASRDALDTFLPRLVAAAEETPVVWLVCVEPRALARLRRRLEMDPAS